MVMDIRFQQLVSEKAQSTPIPMHMAMPVPSVTIEGPQPVMFPKPEIHEPVALAPRYSMTMPTPSATIEEPKPILPYSVSFLQDQMNEPGEQAPSLHTRSMSAGSIPVLFVPPTSLCCLRSDTTQPFPSPHSTPGLFRARFRAEDDHQFDLFVRLHSTHRPPRSWRRREDRPRPRRSHSRDGRVPFGDSRYLVPCESLTSRDALLVALANSLSLLQPGTTSDSSSWGSSPACFPP
jgi:hypothetical protein